jgi:hypothetical protein
MLNVTNTLPTLHYKLISVFYNIHPIKAFGEDILDQIDLPDESTEQLVQFIRNQGSKENIVGLSYVVDINGTSKMICNFVDSSEDTIACIEHTFAVANYEHLYPVLIKPPHVTLEQLVDIIEHTNTTMVI